jgi:hypothetical protein
MVSVTPPATGDAIRTRPPSSRRWPAARCSRMPPSVSKKQPSAFSPGRCASIMCRGSLQAKAMSPLTVAASPS